MMNIRASVYAMVFLCTTLATGAAAKDQPQIPLFDMIPAVSQIKSAVQLILGDGEGAATTQSNYLNNGLGPSQLRSGYFLVNGDVNKAADIQRTFLGNMERMVDGLPVFGHAKGAVHLLNGESEHGWNAIKASTSNGAALLGAIAGGPAGAVGAHVLADTVISGVDVAVSRDPRKLYGIVDYAANIGNKTSGEHFDAIAGLVMDAAGAKATVSKTRQKVQVPVPGSKTTWTRAGSVDDSAGHANPLYSVVEESAGNVAGPPSSRQVDRGSPKFFDDYFKGVRKVSEPIDIPYPVKVDDELPWFQES